VQAVGQSMFVYPLIKAIQELSAQVEALTARITTLEG
jgi:chaperonin cofactor prefoldin